LANISTVVGGSVADRAAAAVNDHIAGNRAGNAGATQNRAPAMVNSLMAGRLPQKIEHVLHASPHQSSHLLPAAPAPAPAPATLAQNQHHLHQQQQQYAYPKQQYPQVVSVQYSSFPTEALTASTMVNLAAMPWAPSPSGNTIYYPGEKQ